MFIILMDEPTLFVFDSEEAVKRDIEPPDAESDVRAIFDDEAIPYRVEWVRPNIRRKWFFGLGPITFGEYRLMPCGEADPIELMRLLEEHAERVDPPSRKESVANLLKTLRRR
jgi:hypothetical protein